MGIGGEDRSVAVSASGGPAGRWLLLTGATSAIGQAVAEKWRQQGGLVVGVTRSAPMRGPRASTCDAWIEADLRQSWEAAERVAAWADRHPMAAFVHAAGVVYADAADATTPDEWEQTWAVNVTAGFALARVLAAQVAGPRSIVLVGSIDAYFAPRAGPDAAYGAAKAAVLGLIRHLAVEWGPRGVRVNAVVPGPMAGGMGLPRDQASQWAAGAADGCLATPAEVAAVIVFLVTAAAGGITGQSIVVDHGYHLGY